MRSSNQNRRTTRALGLLALAAGWAIPATGAMAQDALGDGRGLDNSLNSRSRYNAPKDRSVMTEMRLRNAIVTGNAGGGRSFRGDVGYTAPFDFRGTVAGDDTFEFRRDSFYSAFGAAGVRNADALSYQFSRATGRRPGQPGFGITLERAPGASSASLRRQGPAIVGDAAVYGATNVRGGLRSTASYTLTRSQAPRVLGIVQDSEDSPGRAITASGLRGIRTTPVADFSAAPERPEQAEPAGRTNRLDLSADERAPEGERISNRVDTAHDALMRQIRERNAAFEAEAEEDQPPVEADWERRLRELQQQLIRPTDPNAPAEPGAATDGETEGEAGEDEERRTEPAGVRFDPQTLQLLRAGDEPIASFVGEGDTETDAYVRNLRAGEELLAEGRYFDAEERFSNALEVVEADPTALVARLHAQLGGGLLLSASINLRELALNAPEVVAARYDRKLLPEQARLASLMRLLMEYTGLTERPVGATPPDPLVQREAGLLMAYIGHQTGEPRLVRDGLLAFEQELNQRRREGNPNLPDEALAELLQGIWLAPRPAPAEDGGTP